MKERKKGREGTWHGERVDRRREGKERHVKWGEGREGEKVARKDGRQEEKEGGRDEMREERK